jgi:hypothetical protein
MASFLLPIPESTVEKTDESQVSPRDRLRSKLAVLEIDISFLHHLLGYFAFFRK